jgi:hypothetical protein
MTASTALKERVQISTYEIQVSVRGSKLVPLASPAAVACCCCCSSCGKRAE